MNFKELAINKRRGDYLFGLDELHKVILALEEANNKILSVDFFEMSIFNDKPIFQPTGECWRLEGSGFHDQKKVFTFIDQIRKEYGENIAVRLNTTIKFK